MAVPTGELRRIDDMGVFITTAIFSIFAYVWLLIVLSVWSPHEVEIAEAVVTLVFFILLIVLAFSADRYNAYKKKKFMLENPEKATEIELEANNQFKKILDVKKEPKKDLINESKTSFKDSEKKGITGDESQHTNIMDYQKNKL